LQKRQPPINFQHSTGNGIVLGLDGNMYIADGRNSVIKMISKTQGVVSTFAGTGTSGYEDGPADQARFNQPQGLAMDVEGNLYVWQTGGNHKVRKITPNARLQEVERRFFFFFADGEQLLDVKKATQMDHVLKQNFILPEESQWTKKEIMINGYCGRCWH